MSQMLYTKYRPKSLKEIQNQEEVTHVLLQSIASQNPASAYIFTGGRGTGKTSIARAFARDLGILDVDIIELDAASHSKIEDIRELGESVASLPFYSPYKMYILDEVHMLSKNAANAFLKLLEEPPQHVIFVLATTDPQKLPETILSRCIQFNLKKPTLVQIEKYLKQVTEQEKVQLSDEVLRVVAILGDGSYRDSLSHLQKLTTYEDVEGLSDVHIFALLNISPITSVFTVLKALDTKGEVDVKEALHVLEEIQNKGLDLKYFLNTLITFARLLLLVRFGSKSLQEITAEEGDVVANFIKEQISNKTPKFASQSMKDLLQISESKNSNSQLLGLELLLL